MGFSPGKILKSEIAVGEFSCISGERMITSNCIVLRAKSFTNRHAVWRKRRPADIVKSGYQNTSYGPASFRILFCTV